LDNVLDWEYGWLLLGLPERPAKRDGAADVLEQISKGRTFN
jgi:hypothetical protein